LLVGFAVYYRETLAAALRSHARETLSEQWGAVKGYLRIEKEHEADPNDKEKVWWYYDEEDPDERRIVFDMKSTYLVADASGKPILAGINGKPAVSPTFDAIGVDQNLIQTRVKEGTVKPQPYWDERRNSDGEMYLLRSGVVWDERHRRPYYVSLALKLDPFNEILGRVTWVYVGVIPASLILGGLLGWFMSGRALEPVLEVAQTAQRISGSNLSLRIPTRRAGDELDYLILTFNRMIDRLESSFQQIKQFSTDVSHELRTPITAIRGQLEVALFTAKTTEQYREAMFNALQDIDKLSSIVRALLLLSQAESGQLVLQKSHINLSDVANELAEQFQLLAEEAGIRLTTSIPPGCSADVDRVQIERLLTNLLSNAIKFTPKGGEVQLELESGSDYLQIVVEDTGCGIPTESLPHIFDRFYRVTRPGAAPAPNQGLGLGLSFVAWIVKAHEGKIHVDSTPGQGTKFTVRLPVAGVASDAMPAVTQPV
jgi:heavy metal sensor kinase